MKMSPIKGPLKNYKKYRFECGEARMFQKANGDLYDQAIFKCEWNKSWTPSPILDPCVWIACKGVPRPPNYARLSISNPSKSNETTQIAFRLPPKNLHYLTLTVSAIYEFGENVSYACDENKRFESNRQMDYFHVPCLNNGSFSAPPVSNWPKCVSSK